jgi:hypothetical protein
MPCPGRHHFVCLRPTALIPAALGGTLISQDLAKAETDSGIRHFVTSFADLFGVLCAKLVPAGAIGQMEREGAAFAGFAT